MQHLADACDLTGRGQVVSARVALSVDAALAGELADLSRRKECPPIRKAADSAIREYIDREKARSEEQWWEEWRRRSEEANLARSPDDIDTKMMFEVALTLLNERFGNVASFHGPEIFTGGNPRARPVYMTAGDLCALWRLACPRDLFQGGNRAVGKLGLFIVDMNTGATPVPGAHDDRVDGPRSLRVLPSLTVLFIGNPRRIAIMRLAYPGMECQAACRRGSCAGMRAWLE